MDILLRELAENAGVKSILKKESVLGNLSLSEEALLIASAYRMQPQSMFIVKNNAYSAQKLYNRFKSSYAISSSCFKDKVCFSNCSFDG